MDICTINMEREQNALKRKDSDEDIEKKRKEKNAYFYHLFLRINEAINKTIKIAYNRESVG